MNLSLQAQVILLLTVHFGKVASEEVRPLSPTEWGSFAQWLKERDVSPEALLSDDLDPLLSGWLDHRVTADRIHRLLGRAAALGLALEKWQRAGLWVLTRSDADYPSQLKKRLKTDSPPVLFGCGNPRLLNQGGIGVVGSRDAGGNDLAYATRLGRMAAEQGLSVISGGARGIDETAMIAALDAEGTSVGVLADGLLRAATSAKYRKALMTNNLVLASSFNPEAGFDVGNAMARNKYIYCLSDAVIVVTANQGKGGTWNGAIENLKHHWVPLWVKAKPAGDSGNAALAQRGGRTLPEEQLDLAAVLSAKPSEPNGLMEKLPLIDDPSEPESTGQATGTSCEKLSNGAGRINEVPSAAMEPVSQREELDIGSLSFYELFLLRFRKMAETYPVTLDEMLHEFDVNQGQLNAWIRQALDQGQAEKLTRPVRYRPPARHPWQGSIFGHERLEQLASAGRKVKP